MQPALFLFPAKVAKILKLRNYSKVNSKLAKMLMKMLQSETKVGLSVAKI